LEFGGISISQEIRPCVIGQEIGLLDYNLGTTFECTIPSHEVLIQFKLPSHEMIGNVLYIILQVAIHQSIVDPLGRSANLHEIFPSSKIQ
jgi:hypothetical protein